MSGAAHIDSAPTSERFGSGGGPAIRFVAAVIAGLLLAAGALRAAPGAGPAAEEETSRTHRTLAYLLKTHPWADANGDKVFTRSEMRAHARRRRAAGARLPRFPDSRTHRPGARACAWGKLNRFSNIRNRTTARTTPMTLLLSLLRQFARLNVPTHRATGALRLASLLLVTVGSALAQSTGTVQGRVSNQVTAEYLENAKVTIEGTDRETLTDNSGQYRFANVPAGTVTVKAFYTGFSPQTATVTVGPGTVVQRNFELPPPARSDAADGPVQRLDQFVVSETREMDGAAVAINEQRFAPDVRTVVAANEFGPKGEGDMGELLQFLPGLAIDFGNGGQGSVSINGVPTENVPITIGGFDLATGRNTTGRMTPVNAIPTTYNISRIEILHSPTPESPGMALAGSINVVPLSAFERSRPVFNASVFVMMRDDMVEFDRTAGPGREPTRKVHPGGNFSYILPVNDRFGLTLSGGFSRQFLNRTGFATTWRGAGTVTNGAAFPDTTADRPYLTQHQLNATNMDSSRQSLAMTFDYKLGEHDRLTFSFAYTNNLQKIFNPVLTFAITRVAANDFSSTFTHGASGAGTLTLADGDRIVIDRGYTQSVTYRHQGPVWKWDSGLGLSLAWDQNIQYSKGFFFSTQAQRTGVTIAFDDINATRPGSITVTDPASGAAIDPFNLDNFLLTSVNYHPMDALPGKLNKVDSAQSRAYVNLGRSFDWAVPVAIKGGLDARRNVRDLRIGGGAVFTYVGPDGRTAPQTPFAASDNDAAFLRYDDWQSRSKPGYGFPRIQHLSSAKAFEHFQAHPDYFVGNEANMHRAITNNSKRAEETTTAGYLRSDVHLFDRRLKLVGGLRVEQTNVDAEGQLTDPTRNFQRDASGNVIRGSNGVLLPIATDPLAVAQLTQIERGTQVEKEYLRFFPSLNASFNLRENLIARAAYYHSVGRPNFIQYTGGVTLPNLEAENLATQRITVNNAGIKVWTARTTKLMLEYYFQRVGLLSVGVFRRDFENFFGNVIFPATPEFLALYGLDPAVYGQFDVSTQHNLSSAVRMEGFDVNYKQALTFLPHWARGVQVFANASTLKTMGDESANFSRYIPENYSWGFSLSREKFILKMNWNRQGRRRLDTLNVARGVFPETYRMIPPKLNWNISGEYRLHRHFALYANVTRPVVNDVEIANAATPGHARIINQQQYGGMWTIGITTSY